jgi:hypothetical protein
MNFTCTLVHGYGACLFMSPDTVTHGADFCIDVICRSIQMVYEQIRGHGGTGAMDEDDWEELVAKFPRHLVIQSDNTVSQAKNQFFSLFLAFLVATGLFETATLNFLRVGHTHEDIDQFFSLIVSLILKQHHYETPEDLLNFLDQELRPKFHARREVLVSEMVSGIYDWSTWLCTMNRNIAGCFQNRGKRETPHSFTYKLGRSLRPAEKEWFKGHGGTDANTTFRP